jgi:hypothetical protein
MTEQRPYEAVDRAMRWPMTHVLPPMPLATSADAAADSFLLMALNPSLDGVGRKLFGEKHEASPVPGHATLTRPGASGNCEPAHWPDAT